MPTTIRLVVGDWSGDGHDKTDGFIFRTNWPKESAIKAYTKGAKILGFDLHSDYCNGYQDSGIPEEAIATLEKNGLLDREKDEWYEDEGYLIGPTMWATLYMRVAQLGEPNFTFKESVSKSEINVGGYGLYY